MRTLLLSAAPSSIVSFALFSTNVPTDLCRYAKMQSCALAALYRAACAGPNGAVVVRRPHYPEEASSCSAFYLECLRCF